MTRKTTESYLAVFEFIEERVFKLKPAEFMTDYEDGMRCAIRKHWPNTILRGCWFHLKRAIGRRCNSFGMQRLFNNNSNARIVKDMLTNTPLLPSDQLLEGFKTIQDYAKRKNLDDKFTDIFKYFSRQWLSEVRLYTFTSPFCFFVKN